MNLALPHEFRLSSKKGFGICCDADGAFVGKEPLLKRTCGANGRESWAPRDESELSEALGGAYGLPVDAAPKRGGIAVITRALNEGDVARAQMATLLLRLPDPPTKDAPSPDEIVKLAIRLDETGLLKFNSRHFPAETPGDKGGQFAPKNAEFGDTASDATGAEPRSHNACTALSDIHTIPFDPSKLIIPDESTGSAVFFGKPLTADQFVAWLASHQNTLESPERSENTFNSNREVEAAVAAVPADRGGGDFQADPQLVAFMQRIAQPLANFELNGHKEGERLVSICQNPEGQYTVASIQIMGDQGGRAYLMGNFVAIAHTHPPGDDQPPNNADAGIAITDGKPSFVVGKYGSNIWEIGRNNGVISIRLIGDAPQTYGPWEPFQKDPARYRIYTLGRYPK